MFVCVHVLLCACECGGKRGKHTGKKNESGGMHKAGRGRHRERARRGGGKEGRKGGRVRRVSPLEEVEEYSLLPNTITNFKKKQQMQYNNKKCSV